jgi:hypothetical protein
MFSSCTQPNTCLLVAYLQAESALDGACDDAHLESHDQSWNFSLAVDADLHGVLS